MPGSRESRNEKILGAHSGCFTTTRTLKKRRDWAANIANNKLATKRLLVLDTDHFSEWERGSPAGTRLREKLRGAAKEIALTVITIEEGTRGWLAEIARHKHPHRQIPAYAKLRRQVDVFADWTILPWESESADLFLCLRGNGVRIGTMDLKIACIALSHEATLLTRNTSDFLQVQNLRVENWLD